VRHLVPDREIVSRSLTFKMFSDYGMPVTFYNDQYDLLISQDYLFARKISPEARVLQERLGALWIHRTDFTVSREGPQLYAFLTGRGRVGRRFGTRFWERESTLGPDRELFMLVCKKWHVAKRMLRAAEDRLQVRGIEYLFDEDDMSGAASGRDRADAGEAQPPPPRADADAVRLLRHRPADDLPRPGQHRPDARFHVRPGQCAHPRAAMRVRRPVSGGPRARVGLATDRTPDEVIQRMLPALRHEFADQSVRIREAEFPHHWRLREDRDARENASRAERLL
jgi:hypothetical protein